MSKIGDKIGQKFSNMKNNIKNFIPNLKNKIKNKANQFNKNFQKNFMPDLVKRIENITRKIKRMVKRVKGLPAKVARLAKKIAKTVKAVLLAIKNILFTLGAFLVSPAGIIIVLHVILTFYLIGMMTITGVNEFSAYCPDGSLVPFGGDPNVDCLPPTGEGRYIDPSDDSVLVDGSSPASGLDGSDMSPSSSPAPEFQPMEHDRGGRGNQSGKKNKQAPGICDNENFQKTGDGSFIDCSSLDALALSLSSLERRDVNNQGQDWCSDYRLDSMIDAIEALRGTPGDFKQTWAGTDVTASCDTLITRIMYLSGLAYEPGHPMGNFPVFGVVNQEAWFSKSKMFEKVQNPAQDRQPGDIVTEQASAGTPTTKIGTWNGQIYDNWNNRPLSHSVSHTGVYLGSNVDAPGKWGGEWFAEASLNQFDPWAHDGFIYSTYQTYWRLKPEYKKMVQDFCEQLIAGLE